MSRPFFLRSAAAVFRAYNRHIPLETGRFRIWKSFFRTRAARAGMKMRATAFFGAAFDLDLSDFVQSSIYAFGGWEPVISTYIVNNLKRGDVFIDIGANIGYYTIMSSCLVGDSGRVFSIEASPGIYKKLQRNMALNPAGNIQAVNIAVADHACQIPIWITDERNSGRTTIVQSMAGDGTAGIEAHVEARPLDQIVPLDDILNARFIKIDVEGAEWLVLQGIRHLLPRLAAHTEILVEVSVDSLRNFGVELDECLKLFTDAGFTPFMIDGPMNEPYRPMRNADRGITALPPDLASLDMVDLLFRKLPDPA